MIKKIIKNKLWKLFEIFVFGLCCPGFHLRKFVKLNLLILLYGVGKLQDWQGRPIIHECFKQHHLFFYAHDILNFAH